MGWGGIAKCTYTRVGWVWGEAVLPLMACGSVLSFAACVCVGVVCFFLSGVDALPAA